MLSKIFSFFVIALLSSCLNDCHKNGEALVIEGQTMGTYYKVSIFDSKPKEEAKIKSLLEKNLKDINDKFSTYLSNSQISQLNNHESNTAFKVDDEFILLLETSHRIQDLSDGAFNIYIDDLIDLWGFDKSGRVSKKPEYEKIKILLEQIKKPKIKIENNFLKKSFPKQKINFSSIAKGYGVDKIAAVIKKIGFENFLIDIGGELRSVNSSQNKKEIWIGLENPLAPLDKDKLIGKIRLNNKAIASSGNYLNYFKDNDENYGHIIDPITGYPTKTDLLSVFIISDDCMTADALATAIMVLGSKKAKDMLSKFENSTAILVTNKNGVPHIEIVGKFKEKDLVLFYSNSEKQNS